MRAHKQTSKQHATYSQREKLNRHYLHVKLRKRLLVKWQNWLQICFISGL